METLDNLNRALELPLKGKDSFFLWGPRQTGKSSLLKASYRNGTARKRTSSRRRRTNDRSVLKVHEDHEDDENAENGVPLHAIST